MSRRQGGVALVSVLLVVAVAIALAYQMVSRQGLNIVHSRQILDGSQARQYALGGEQYARQLLYADWEEEKTRNKDTLLEEWAGISSSQGEQDAPPLEHEAGIAMPFEIEDGTLEIRIEDLGARFNLNSVAGSGGAQNLARLKRLLTHLNLDPNAADAWLDWIDEDQNVQGFGAEDSDYLLREPARRSANQRAAHVSEFLVAASLSLEEFARLRPHLATLPVAELRINVNTATEALLATVAPNFSPAQLDLLMASPREFSSIEAVIADYAALGASASVLAVASEFFRVQVRVQFGEARSELTSAIHRDPASGTLTLLSRSFGEPFDAYRPQNASEDEEPAEVDPDTAWFENRNHPRAAAILSRHLGNASSASIPRPIIV